MSALVHDRKELDVGQANTVPADESGRLGLNHQAVQPLQLVFCRGLAPSSAAERKSQIERKATEPVPDERAIESSNDVVSAVQAEAPPAWVDELSAPPPSASLSPGRPSRAEQRRSTL